MLAESLLAIHRRRPFKPYLIHTASGESYRITHPEGMTLSESQRTLVTLNDNELVMVDVASISAVTQSQEVPPSPVDD